MADMYFVLSVFVVIAILFIIYTVTGLVSALKEGKLLLAVTQTIIGLAALLVVSSIIFFPIKARAFTERLDNWVTRRLAPTTRNCGAHCNYQLP